MSKVQGKRLAGAQLRSAPKFWAGLLKLNVKGPSFPLKKGQYVKYELAVGSLQIFIQLIPNTVNMVNNVGKTDFESLDNGVEMSLIFQPILGPLVFGWAPNHFVLGAQLAPG